MSYSSQVQPQNEENYLKMVVMWMIVIAECNKMSLPIVLTGKDERGFPKIYYFKSDSYMGFSDMQHLESSDVA